MRLILDVETQPGNQSASSYSRSGLFEFIDSLPPQARPVFIRGDIGFGNEGTMLAAERRGQPYLFKLRQTKKVKRLIEQLFDRDDWTDAGQGWQGVESELRLSGWSRARHVHVLRRPLREDLALEGATETGQLEFAIVEALDSARSYEYAVHVTTLDDEILTIAQHYRDRADAENPFDELKNQWGWGGYTTHDLKRCGMMARHTALIYNWWSLFARLAIPHKGRTRSVRHAEALTSRPLLLHAVGKQTRHGGQTLLTITSTHGKSSRIRKILRYLTAFFRAIRATAEQLNWLERWRVILSRAFVQFLRGRPLRTPNLIGSSP